MTEPKRHISPSVLRQKADNGRTIMLSPQVLRELADYIEWMKQRIDEPHFYGDAIYHIGKTEPTERPQCIADATCTETPAEYDELNAGLMYWPAHTFEHDIYRIKSWAKQAGIYEHSTVQAQVLKGVSEMGELADAVINGDQEAAEDAYGDVIVCLVNAAHMQGIDIADAFAKVADIVTARKGRMVPGGAFVKTGSDE